MTAQFLLITYLHKRRRVKILRAMSGGVSFSQRKSYSWGGEWGRASYTEDSGHESYKERWIAFKWQNSGKSKTGFPIQSHLGVSVGTICQLPPINKRRIDLLYGRLWNKSVQDIYIYPCMQTHCSTVLI